MQSPSASNLIHRNIKQATQPYHDRLECHLPLLDPELSWTQYRSSIENFYGFYMPLEATMLKAATGLLHEEVLSRRKVPWLIGDLVTMGLTSYEIGRLPHCAEIPRVQTDADLLGMLYVVEGATLGGQVVVQSLGRSLGTGSLTCSSFFQSYQGDVPKRWQGLLDLLKERIETLQQEGEAIQTACATFNAFERWLVRANR
jgi:heme oxygenase (biliverdin-IX-beta and delta-forming)